MQVRLRRGNKSCSALISLSAHRLVALKFTIFGLTISSAWGNGHATLYRGLLRALHRRGHEVHFFEKDVPYYASHRDLADCDFCDLHLYSSWPEIRRHALALAADSDVTIVASYCPEGADISDEILRLPRPLRIFYDLDTPITLDRLSHGEVPYLRAEQIPEFDLYLSFTGGKALEHLERRWNAKRVRPLFGSVDPTVHRRTLEQAAFQYDLSYMGTYAPDRQPALDQLFLEPARRFSERKFVLAGSLYPFGWVWPENVARLEHVAPSDHSVFFSSSRCTLNITRQEMAQNGYCPSGRFFEAAACGTAIVTDDWEGLASFFTPGEELLVVGSAEDVISALNTPENDLTQIAARAYERVLSEHTAENRADDLLRYIDECSTVSGQSLERPRQCQMEQAS